MEAQDRLDIIASPQAPGKTDVNSDETLIAPEQSDAGELTQTSGVRDEAAFQTESETVALSPDSDFDQQTLLRSDAVGDPGTGNLATEVADSWEAALQDAQPSVEPGESQIGRFRVRKLLGEGAFGSVYLAHDPHLDRMVAIKVAKTGVISSRSDVNRFLREARAAANLRHPNIVPVYEVGRFGSSSFLAYEYIEGRTLGSLLKEKRKLDPRTAAELMRTIARALDYAHSLGIVHRDVKPDNVLLDSSGQPHVADFGLARRGDQEADKTREGLFMGTPMYMSPEQASGLAFKADGRSDVWSLGVMFREMLTGTLPFKGNVTQVLIAVRNSEPASIRTLDRTLPMDLETICQKCMTKGLDQRYQSAGELADELDRWLNGEPIRARPISAFARMVRWTQRNPTVASLLGTIGGVMLLGTVVSTYFAIAAERQSVIARKEQRERALAQLNGLKTSVPESVPVLIETLLPFRDDISSQLNADLARNDLPAAQQTRLRLASLSLFPAEMPTAHLEAIPREISKSNPEEAAMLVTLLQPFRKQVAPGLRNLAHNPEIDREQRFIALCALAALAPDSPDWDADSANLGAGLLSANPTDLPAWLEMIQPLRDRLAPEIRKQFTSGEPGVRQQAASVLALMYANLPAKLYELALDSDQDQLRPILAKLHAIPNAWQELEIKGLPVEPDDLQDSRSVRRHVNMFIVLLAIAPDKVPWHWLAMDATPDIRTELTHAIAPSGASWTPIAERLSHETDSSIRQSLLESLAEYPITVLLPGDRLRMLPGTLELFRRDPDPGVHATAGWLLERWGAHEQLTQARRDLRRESPPPTQKWQVDSQGIEFSLVDGPVDFKMGADPSDPLKAPIERQHVRRIPHHFGISNLEVTVESFCQFSPDHAYNPEVSPESQCPVSEVTWFDAAKYCRWLSEKAGLPESEMCFPPINQIGPEMKLPVNVLQRTGYRLPTAGEWEFACRAGAMTPRPFGYTSEKTTSFAWFERNANNRSWPVGKLRPNRLGLFDMHGNMMEWCLDWYFDDYPTPIDDRVLEGTDNRAGVYREVRGGAFNSSIDLIRTPDRDYDLPFNKSYIIGFRLAKTVPR